MFEDPPLEIIEPHRLPEGNTEASADNSATMTVDDAMDDDASPRCQLCGERFASVAELKHHVLVSYGGVEASDEETVYTTEEVKCDQKECGINNGPNLRTQEFPNLDFSKESCVQIITREDISDVFETISDSRILGKTHDNHDAFPAEISDYRTSNGTKVIVEESVITICIPSSLSDEYKGLIGLDGNSDTIIEVDSEILETYGDKNYFPCLLEQSQDSDIAASATKPAIILWEESPEESETSDVAIFPPSSWGESHECRGEDKRNISAEHIASERAETGDNNLECDESIPNTPELKSHQLSNCQNSRPMLPFMCEICGKQFSSMQKLRCHIRIHTGEKPFKCGSCDASFRYLRTKKHHEESHSEPKQRTNRCEICGKSFLRMSYFAEHLKTHSGEKPWKCESCPKSFLSSSMLDRHARSHIRKQLKDKSFLLLVNGKPSMIRGNSSTDAEIQENENTSAEDGIGDLYESRDKTEEERVGVEEAGGKHCSSNQLATGEVSAKRVDIKGLDDTSLIRWECGVCAKSFCSKHTLLQHSTIHSGEKKYKCSECDATFSRRDVLKGHEESQHRDGRQNFPCNICDKSLKTRVGLKRHMAKHLGSSPYACRKCPSLFSEKRALMVHAETHSEERNFLCEECPATFKTGPGLRSHVLHCHVAQKPFPCASCSANFSSAGALRDHRRTHVVDDQVMAVQRRHACPLCGKRFARAQTLLEHTFTHTGAKPSKCKVCGQGFASVSNLNRHTRTHHVKTPFRCGICGETCSTRIMLRRHAMTHAGGHPLLCHVCGKRFVFPHDLTVHARSHASTRVYTCEVCGKEFTNKSSYFGHKHTHKKWKGELVNEEMPNDKLSSLLDELIEGVV